MHYKSALIRYIPCEVGLAGSVFGSSRVLPLRRSSHQGRVDDAGGSAPFK